MTLLVVGEAITAFMRTVDDFDSSVPFEPPIPSGAPMIFASVASRLGDRVRPVAAVGDDLFGREMIDTLSAHGCDTRWIAVSSQLPTTIAFVNHRRDGERRFSFYLDGTAGNTVTATDAAEAAQGADWIHVSGSAVTMGGTLPDAVMTAVDRVLENGGRLSVDPNIRRETATTSALNQVRSLVERAQLVLPSAGELDALGVETDQLVAAGVAVVSTSGAGPIEMHDSRGRSTFRPPSVTEVNADGAGDTFAAGCVVGLRRGLSLYDAVQVGASVAAAAVQTSSPMSGTATPDMVTRHSNVGEQ